VTVVDATVKVRESDGTLVFDLSAGGYGVGPVSDDGFTWQSVRARSPFVDGWTLVQATRDGGILTFSVRVEGSTWVQVEQRRIALAAALSEFAYKVEVYASSVSVTYRADPADMQPEPLTGPTVTNKARQFVVSVPVQPNPVVTGV
jgi:hypothetical protein